MSNGDSLKWSVEARVMKWQNPEDHKNGESPDEVIEAPGNALLDEGVTRMLNLLGGIGGIPYSNATAQIGVGDGTAAVDPSQTDLQGANTFYENMDAGNPSVSGRTITFRSTFDDADANFAWEEWSIRNDATDAENLNRRVVNLGTKAGGVWALEVEITVT